jgi:hypothetical protein
MATAISRAGTGAILLSCRCRLCWWLLMPYTLHEDNIGSDPRWMALAKLQEKGPVPNVAEDDPATVRAYLRRVGRRRRDLLAAYLLLTSEVALVQDDGYIGQEAALECAGETWVLKALLTPVCGRPPLLHQRGQKCSAKNCIDSSPEWRPGYEYRVCAFLKRNPSKAEVERNKAQKDDARDQRLRALLMERDGAFCRYCRSGPLSEKAGRAIERRKVLQRDHIDPDRPAGPDAENYVTACAGCNEHKGRRTPFEADMALLDPPTAEEKAAWMARGLALFDRPPITDEPPSDHRRNTDQNSDPDTDPNTVPDADPTTINDIPWRPDQPDDQANQHDHRQNHGPEGVDSGRVGQPHGGGPAGPGGQPVRDSSAPDIYHRRSRAPEPRAGPP